MFANNNASETIQMSKLKATNRKKRFDCWMNVTEIDECLTHWLYDSIGTNNRLI